MATASFLLTRARRWGHPGWQLQVRIRAMLAVRRSRRDLANLDARLLQDVGLTAGQVERESTRPFWDVPPHWRA